MENKKLTICFFGSARSIHTIKWINYFSKKGYKTHLFSYDRPNSNSYNFELHLLRRNFPVKIWPFNTILNIPSIYFQIKNELKTLNPDIVHAHYVTEYGNLAYLLKFHPFIITAWGSDILINPEENRIIKIITKKVLKNADLITCDAKHMKEAMVKLDVDESKIKIINFGIDVNKFSPGEKNDAIMGELGVGLRYKIVISLRNFEPIYDVKTLVQAIPAVLKEAPETIFFLIGKGTQEENLKIQAEKVGVSRNIRFIGRLPNEKLPDYLRTADIYVSTSLSDGGIASSTAEAMACELPVIITDTGDNKEWIKDSENGFVIPVKNPKILAEKIIFILKNESLRKKFGQINRQIISEKNNYYIEMEKMEELYKNLVKK